MSRRVELLIGALLAVTIGIVLLFGVAPEQESPFDPRASTFHGGPGGSKAVYDVLARLGVMVERVQEPLFDLNRTTGPRAAVLVVLNPPIALEPAELAQVVRFVRAGGAVVVAGSGGGVTRCVGWRTANGTRLMRVDTLPVRSPSGLDLPPVGDYLRPRGSVDEGGRRARDSDAEFDDCEMLVPVAHDTLLRLRDGRPVALRFGYRGGGRVTLVADADYFRNRTWRWTDVPAFVVPLLTPTRPGPVAWDEYHQGFAEESSVTAALMTWLQGSPLGWALLQLVGVVCVAFVVAAVRFGPALPAIERRRRSPLEHLEGLAAGLEGAAGVDTSIELTVSGLRRRLGRAGVMRPDERRSWLAALELALPTPRGRDAARRLQRTISEPGGPERALAAAQAVEDVWEELRPRTTRAAS